MKYYAGIGSRQTPGTILNVMKDVAFYLSLDNYVLRSGAASGADTAFEEGCDRIFGEKEIYLPSPRFNNSLSELYIISEAAKEVAKSFHPNFNGLSDYAKLLMSRNSYQVLGKDLNSPSLFVICWTDDGSDGIHVKTSGKTGGTGQAIRIANHYGIPVHNLRNEKVLEYWSEWLKQTEKYFHDRYYNPPAWKQE